MTKWPDSTGAVFRRYVQGLGLRTAMAARVYHCILRRFQRLVCSYDPAFSVSQASLTAWIQDRIKAWPLHLVIHRARLVHRFLDWLVNAGYIAENPLAKLRAEYRQHSTAPIVRALADPNPVAALEKLRTLPPFGSHLGSAMRAHISVMRAAGFRYGDYENRLLGLDRFLQQQPDAAEQPLAALIQRWAQEASRLELHVARVRVGRIVARALQHEDPSVIMPRLDRQLVREVRRRQRRPHIFSAEEIRKLFQTALAFPSPHTILAYRDAWRLFLRFVADRTGRPVAKLTLSELTAGEVIAFLQHVETGRGASIATRNCRLAALRSFFLFVADREPSAAAQCAEVLRIPSKKKAKRAICYLEQEEVAAILAQPNQTTLLGQRDHALLGFLYNTGARIQEALDVCPKHLHLESPAHVRLSGKGRKERICPLWPETANLILALLHRRPRSPDEPIFCNRYGGKLGASGVRFQLRHYVESAHKKMPGLSSKRISPHTFRHTTAVHLIAAGVDVTVIRSWLGHAHLDTTNHYAQADLKTKRVALEQVASKWRPSKPPRWKRDHDLLAWLNSL